MMDSRIKNLVEESIKEGNPLMFPSIVFDPRKVIPQRKSLEGRKKNTWNVTFCVESGTQVFADAAVWIWKCPLCTPEFA